MNTYRDPVQTRLKLSKMNTKFALCLNLLEKEDNLEMFDNIIDDLDDIIIRLEHFIVMSSPRNIVNHFINKNFIKLDDSVLISKSLMLDYFRSFAIGEGIKLPGSKVEKQLDRFIKFKIIDKTKYYIGYKYIYEEDDS
jgi:hypothetical protein